MPRPLPTTTGETAVLRLLQAESGRRAFALQLIIVLVLLATAQGFDGSVHTATHWVVLGTYALCSISLGLMDWRTQHRGRGREPGGRAGDEGGAEWLAWTATLLNAGVALFVVVEHMVVGALDTEETASAVSRLPAFLLLLQTGLSMRVWHTVLFSGLVTLAWGGAILFAHLVPESAHLGPHVTLAEEVPGLLTFLAAALVVVDGVRRLRSALAAALTMERERTTLARFVPDSVAAALAREGGIGAVRSRHACLFALDIRGFSAFTRAHSEEDVVRTLLAVRALTHVAVTEHGGLVDKYVGDGILAQFVVGRPEAQAAAALACARTVTERLERLNRKRATEAAPTPAPLRITLALHAGTVLVGVFDDGHRAEFTVLGEAMNQLARIETAAKAQDVPVAASDRFTGLLDRAAGESVRLRAMPRSDCADTGDLRLFGVSWPAAPAPRAAVAAGAAMPERSGVS